MEVFTQSARLALVDCLQRLGLDEQGGEVLRVRRRPRDLGGDGPARTVQAGQPAVDEGLALPDVQVAPCALARVAGAVAAAAPLYAVFR